MRECEWASVRECVSVSYNHVMYKVHIMIMQRQRSHDPGTVSHDSHQTVSVSWASEVEEGRRRNQPFWPRYGCMAAFS